MVSVKPGLLTAFLQPSPIPGMGIAYAANRPPAALYFAALRPRESMPSTPRHRRFIRSLHNLRQNDDGVVATIGSFDGIHRGHQAIMGQVLDKAAAYGLPSMAMFFEPHPREFFSREQAPARLMRLHEKLDSLYALGIERICCLRFNQSLSALSASDFIRQVLVEGVGLRCLVVGNDFRFGCDREGDTRLLREAGEHYGFEVIDTAAVLHQGRRISSTWVREALEASNFALAADLLGRPFSLSGRVVHGQKLGSQLGVPTANVNLNRYRAPLSGTFVVEVPRPVAAVAQPPSTASQQSINC